MVSPIVPGAVGAGALGVDSRFGRTASAPAPARDQPALGDRLGDRVELGGAAAWVAARESVRNGLNHVHRALALGHDAQGLLVRVQELARDGGPEAQGELQAVLGAFARRVEDAVAQGARLAAGEDVSVQAEPGGASVTIAGADLRLKDAPGWGDVIAVPRGASVDNPAALGRAVQKSLDALQNAIERLFEAARALEAHQGFLGAAETVLASGVRHDLDADAARLLALQVRQGLDAGGAIAIANVEPQAVLSLFRS